MQTLIIKDLVKTEELDSTAMAAVTGGTGYSYAYCAPTPSYCPPDLFGGPRLDVSANSTTFDASQMLGQTQNTVVNNGNNVAFSSGITANVAPSQNGKNTINFG
ncbi:MAG TPA: hypothetical protein VGE12_06525 [Noviherbaspirillum sp.]